MKVCQKFSFQYVSLEELLNQLRNLGPTKASPFGSIPVKTLTEHSDLFALILKFFVDESANRANFPKE